MYRKVRFHQGERVNAISLTGKKVIGIYRGVAATKGAYVYGLEEGDIEQALHLCLTLTLERPPIEKPKRNSYKHSLAPGDPCEARTPKGQKIHGKYMNSEGKHAWIRGWPEGANRLSDLPEAYKVLTSTLQKV